MNPNPPSKRKSLIFSFLVLLLVAGGIHFFIVYKANSLLPDLVQRLTSGKYELKIQKLHFRYWDASIDIKGIELNPSVDSLHEEYHVSASSLHLKLHSIFPLLTGSDIEVQELNVDNPKIQVKRNEKIIRVIKRSELHILIGSLQNAAVRFLKTLQVVQFSIRNASFQYYPFPNKNNHYNISNINIMMSDVHVNETDQELEGKINISVLDPGLIIPDTLKQIQLDKFIWDNQKDQVDVGKFLIFQKGKKNISDSTKVELDALMIKKLYWKEWLQTGRVHVDSLLAENGNMYFSTSGTPVKRKHSDSLDLKKLKVWDVIGNLKVGYFSARKILASIINTEPNWERDNTIIGDSLVIKKLEINPGINIPLSMEDLAIGVQSFVDKGKGKKMHTSFTGLRLNGDTLSLNHYVVKTTVKSKFGEGSLLSIPLVRMIGVSVKDIMDKKAAINEIWMQNPYLKIRGNAPGERKFNNAMPSNLMDELKSYVDLQKIFILNGNLDYVNRLTGKSILHLSNFSTTILARKFLSSLTISEALREVINTSAGSLQYKFGENNIELGDIHLDYSSGKMKIGSADFGLSDIGLLSKLKGIQLEIGNGLNPLIANKNWHFKMVRLDSGFLKLDQEAANQRPFGTDNKKNFLFDSLSIGQLKIQLAQNKWKLDARIFKLQSKDLQVLPDIASWSLFKSDVGNLQYVSKDLELLINKAEIDPLGKSIFRESNIFREADDLSVKASLPITQTGSNFHDTKFRPLSLDLLSLTRPTIEVFINNTKDGDDVSDSLKNLFSLGSLSVNDPRLFVTSRKKDETFSFGTAGEMIRGKGLSVLGNRKIYGISMNQLSASFGASEVNAASKNIFRTGLIDFDIQEIYKDRLTPLQASIKKFNVGSFKLNRIRDKDTLEFKTGGVYLGEIPKFILNRDSILNTVFKLPPAEILPSTFTLRTPDKELGIFNLTANTKEEYLKWDSLSFRNRLSRQDFFNAIPFEKDYITLSTGKVNAEILRPVIYGNDTTVFVHRLTIDPLDLKVERDKRIKDDTIKYRPLLAKSLKKIPFPFRIDSIQLMHSTIWHNVIDERTGKEGTIYFRDIDGQLLLVKNFDYQENDSLIVNLDSKLMGRGDLKFVFRQDYNDSLQTFLLNAKMGSMDMKEMNRLLQPLQNVRVDKGVISDLSLKAKGNDVLAYGTMEMFYDDLKVSVLRDDGKRDRVKSWLANVFLRSDNRQTGILYTERAKEKAIYNFWGKIAFNGLLTNLGVKKNNRQEKRFYRGLQKHQLPEDVF